MKTASKFLLIVFFSSLFSFLACQKQSAEWKGAITEEDGIIVIKNPDKPIFKEPLFTLEEELSIGGSDVSGNPVLSQVQGIAVDNNERIYVLEVKEAHVKVFDRSGKFLKTLGKKGQGPGELSFPVRLYISPQQEILIEDVMNRRFTFFSYDEGYLRTLSNVSMNIGNLEIDTRGNIYGITEEPTTDEIPQWEIKKFDHEFNYQYSLGYYPYLSEGFVRLFGEILEFDVMNGGNGVDVTPDDYFILGDPREYTLRVFNPEGQLARRIEKEYTPVEITEEELEEGKKNIRGGREVVFPKRHLACRVFQCDEEKRIYVGLWEKAEDGTSYYYDVFDSDGKYINKLPLKVRPWIWENGKLYALEEDDEGFHFVKRYKVNWNIDLSD